MSRAGIGLNFKATFSSFSLSPSSGHSIFGRLTGLRGIELVDECIYHARHRTVAPKNASSIPFGIFALLPSVRSQILDAGLAREVCSSCTCFKPIRIGVYAGAAFCGGVQVVVFASTRRQTPCFRASPVADSNPGCYASASLRI
jgi:hypothetical protein